MYRPIVACDMDDVVANLVPAWLELYGKLTGDIISPESITSWNIGQFARDPTTFYQVLDRSDLFRFLDPVAGSIEGINRLSETSDIYFLTDGQAKYAASEKQAWVDTHFPQLSRKRVIISSAKHLIKADILIDDSPRHLSAFPGYTLKFNRPWNTGVAANWNASSWEELTNLWPEVYSTIQRDQA